MIKKPVPTAGRNLKKSRPLEICLLVRPLAGAASEIPEKFHFSTEFLNLLQDGKFQNGEYKNLELAGFITELTKFEIDILRNEM